MIIIKLGGSLSRSDALVNCLNAVEKNYQGRAVVIVPGGGAFANSRARVKTSSAQSASRLTLALVTGASSAA